MTVPFTYRCAYRGDGLWPVLLGFTRGMDLDEPEAEDAAQRALLNVFSRIATFDRARNGVAVTIAAYEVLTVRQQRSRRREASVEGLADLGDGQARPEEHLLAEELRRAVRVGEPEDLGARDGGRIRGGRARVRRAPGSAACW